MRRLGIITAVSFLAVLTAGCLVDVQHVTDAGPAFAEARRDAGRLQGLEGPPENLNILAFDPDDGELVRVRVPMWLAEELGEDSELDIDIDAEDREALRRHVGRDLDLDLEELKKAGLGILVEVNEDDGERVLIWLS